jgi:hypothetical protein
MHKKPGSEDLLRLNKIGMDQIDRIGNYAEPVERSTTQQPAYVAAVQKESEDDDREQGEDKQIVESGYKTGEE